MSTPTPDPALSLNVTPAAAAASAEIPFDDESPEELAAIAEEVGEPAPENDLAALRSELARDEEEVRKANNPDVTYRSPGRDDYSLRFSTVLSDEDLKAGRARSRAGNRRDRRAQGGELDQMKWNLWLLSKYNTAILRHGREIRLPGGGLLRFSTREFLELTQTTTIVAGIRKWFAEDDGAIVGMGMELLAASSWGNTVEEADGDEELVVIPPTRVR